MKKYSFKRKVARIVSGLCMYFNGLSLFVWALVSSYFNSWWFMWVVPIWLGLSLTWWSHVRRIEFKRDEVNFRNKQKTHIFLGRDEDGVEYWELKPTM
jgi:hypothetical protein